MSVQVSYKKQTLLGNNWVINFISIRGSNSKCMVGDAQVSCEFEENEIFMNMDEEKRRQLCVDLYER